jgi:hypothetical protein
MEQDEGDYKRALASKGPSWHYGCRSRPRTPLDTPGNSVEGLLTSIARGSLFRLAVLAHFSGERSLTYRQQWLLVQLHSAGPPAQRAMRARSEALAAGAAYDAATWRTVH